MNGGIKSHDMKYSQTWSIVSEALVSQSFHLSLYSARFIFCVHLLRNCNEISSMSQQITIRIMTSEINVNKDWNQTYEATQPAVFCQPIAARIPCDTVCDSTLKAPIIMFVYVCRPTKCALRNAFIEDNNQTSYIKLIDNTTNINSVPKSTGTEPLVQLCYLNREQQVLAKEGNS